MNTKRLYTWDEALAAVREGEGEDAAVEFAEAMETLATANSDMARLKARKEAAVAVALRCLDEWIGGENQFMGPYGMVFERMDGRSVSYPLDALRAAGVTEEQIAMAKKETKWETVAQPRK